MRNVRRHSRQNLLIGLMVLCTCVVLFFSASLAHDAARGWRLFLSTTYMGDYNVSCYPERERDYTFPSFSFPRQFIPDEVIGCLDRAGVAYSKRMRLGGALYNYQNGQFEGFALWPVVGIDFEKELPHLKNLEIVSGRYDPAMIDGVLVTKKLADAHGWKVGDEVNFYLRDVDNNAFPYTFRIMGIMRAKKDSHLEDRGTVPLLPMVIGSYAYLAKILGAPEGACLELTVWDGEGRAVPEVRRICAERGLDFFYSEGAYGVVSGIVEFIQFGGMFIGVSILVILVVTAFNLNIMSFLERRREVGTMIAMGARPAWLAGLLTAEAGILSILSFALSFLVYAIFVAASSGGLAVGSMSVMFAGNLFCPSIVPSSLALGFGFTFTAMLLASLYPIRMAASLNPVEVFNEGQL